jgi:hypothetical protein
MFKYIAEIIGKISVAQRIWALVFVLISIVVVTLGPSLLDVLSQDNEELNLKVERQRKQIISLSLEVDSLNYSIIRNQRECTNRIVEREQEIWDEIDRLERMIRSQNQMIVEPRTGSNGDENIPLPMYLPDNSNEHMVNGLKKIKKNIKDHMEECKENGK